MRMDEAEIKRLAQKVDKFCTMNNIRDSEIACSILDVMFGWRMGISPREVLGPVSDAYRTTVVNYANRVKGVQ